MKAIALKNIGIINLVLFMSLFFANSIKAESTIKLGSSLSKSDISQNCQEVFFYVIDDINSKEPQDIKGYLDGFRQNLELSLILSKNNVMTSPKLQAYWSNLIHQYCPAINQVKFGKYRTDWSEKYVVKNGKMMSAFKEKPNILGLDYKQAREKILAEGWKPVDTKNDGIGGYVNFVAFEYPEVYDCAGSGVVPCMFFFDNPDDNYYLKVTTAGQFDDNYNGGKITSVEVKSSMGGTEYENNSFY